METKNIILTALGVLVGGFVIALIVFNVNSVQQDKTEDDSSKSNSEVLDQYTGLPEENRFVKESGSEIVNRFASGTGVIFLGYTDCPWCQKAAPLLNEAAEAENVQIYHLDIKKEYESATAEYGKIVSTLTPYLPKDENGEVLLTTPDISFVKNGEIIWRNEMENVTDDEKTPETYWTEERERRAVEQFREKIRELL